MKKELEEKEKILKDMIFRYPQLSVCQSQIKDAYQVLEHLYEDYGGGTLCGRKWRKCSG